PVAAAHLGAVPARLRTRCGRCLAHQVPTRAGAYAARRIAARALQPLEHTAADLATLTLAAGEGSLHERLRCRHTCLPTGKRACIAGAVLRDEGVTVEARFLLAHQDRGLRRQ